MGYNQNDSNIGFFLGGDKGYYSYIYAPWSPKVLDSGLL
ncbi:MAG: hypothetical protein CM15mP59_3990 [Flavobacteriaceae bacterium]|nr:MAG: hypothetical protein CM15mP59_3990 [Flavobacteriaceae bacterium]